MRTVLLSFGLSLSLLTPMTAMAQLTPEEEAPITSPEEVLLLENALTGQGYINPRLASKIAEIQMARANRRREEEIALANASSSRAAVVQAKSSSSQAVVELETEGLQTAAPNNTSNNTPTFSAAELRAIERIRRNQLINSLYGDIPELHRGAPLAASGAGLWLIVMAVSAGGVLTFWQAKRMGMKMKLKMWK